MLELSHVSKTFASNLFTRQRVRAVDDVLAAGYRTADIAKGEVALTTDRMTDKIIENI